MKQAMLRLFDCIRRKRYGSKLFACIAMLICICMAGITMVSFGILKNMFFRGYQQSDETYLTCLAQIYEDKMREYQLIAQNIYADRDVRVLASKGDNSDISEMMRISKYFSSVVSLDQVVSSILLYRGDQVLSSYSGQNFLATEDEKRQMVSMVAEEDQPVGKVIDLTYVSGRQILCGFKDVNRSTGVYSGTILVIDETALQNFFIQNYFTKGTMTYIEDRSRGIVLTDDKDMAQTALAALDEEVGGFESIVAPYEGTNYLCSALEGENGLYCVRVMDYDALLHNITSVRNYMILLIVGTLMVVGPIAYWLSMRFSRPVQKLMSDIFVSQASIARNQVCETIEDASRVLNSSLERFKYMENSMDMAQLAMDDSSAFLPPPPPPIGGVDWRWNTICSGCGSGRFRRYA